MELEGFAVNPTIFKTVCAGILLTQTDGASPIPTVKSGSFSIQPPKCRNPVGGLMSPPYECRHFS